MGWSAGIRTDAQRLAPRGRTKPVAPVVQALRIDLLEALHAQFVEPLGCADLRELMPHRLLALALSELSLVPVTTAFAYWAVVEAGHDVRANTMSMALLALSVSAF